MFIVETDKQEESKEKRCNHWILLNNLVFSISLMSKVTNDERENWSCIKYSFVQTRCESVIILLLKQKRSGIEF